MNTHAQAGRNWFKSSFCETGSGGCVEIAVLPDGVAVRDGKDPHGGELRFTVVEWIAFLSGVGAGEFGLT
jgi:hypothetical protein